MRIALTLWLASGCVLKGQHELVQIQLEATRTAFSTRAAQCEATIRDLESELDRRVGELDEAAVRVDQLRTLSELKDTELETVVAEQVAIAEELRRARAELEALKGRLARLEARDRIRRGRPRRERPDGPELTEADKIAESAAQRALATLQARVMAQLDRELAQQLDDRTHDQLQTELEPLLDDDFLVLVRAEDGTVIRIETRRLFQEGWTTLSPRGLQIVDAVGGALAKLPGRIVSVEGHTDDAPVHSAQYPSNWERAFGPAVAVLRQLRTAAPNLRISATSHASRQPVVPHDTPGAEAQNRRVEIRVRADPDLLERPALDDDGAGEAPSETGIPPAPDPVEPTDEARP